MMHFLENWIHRNLEPKIRAKDFPVESSLSIVYFSIRTLMEEIKPVVTENYRIDFGDESLLFAQFGIFRLKRFLGEEQNQ